MFYESCIEMAFNYVVAFTDTSWKQNYKSTRMRNDETVKDNDYQLTKLMCVY